VNLLDLLDAWLRDRLDAGAHAWLEGACRRVADKGPGPDFYLAFGTAKRKVGAADLALGESELAAASGVRRGFQPALWSMEQAARARLLLALPPLTPADLTRAIDRLCEDGDLGELVALYQALPLLPHPAAHRARAAEGVRSNMKPVFESIALRNPYPSEELDEAAWNQLVVKCFFVGSSLHLVDGLDGRVNVALGNILADLARERWAAGRVVSPELWRCVGPLADGAQLADLGRAIATGTDLDRAAVALSARHNPNAEAVLFAKSRLIGPALTRYPTWDAVAVALAAGVAESTEKD
jgi:hypothetical protein